MSDRREGLCARCHETKPGSDFYLGVIKNGKRYDASWCKECINAYVSEWGRAHRQDRREASQRAYLRGQSGSLSRATNTGKEWTGPELELIADHSRTALELALMLGRTKAAVKSQRRLLLHDPRKDRLAGLTRAATS